MDWLIQSAYAQAEGGGTEQLMGLLPLVLIFAVFYSLMIYKDMFVISKPDKKPLFYSATPRLARFKDRRCYTQNPQGYR